MSRSKTKMPEDVKRKCKVVIHTATTAATAAGALPIPMSDTVPITAAQIAMVVALGKVFNLNLSQSTAKSIATTMIARQAGKTIVANAIKMVPGVGTIVGGVISATTAAAITEAMGWIIADDFYRMSQGEEAEELIETASFLSGAFEGVRFHK